MGQVTDLSHHVVTWGAWQTRKVISKLMTKVKNSHPPSNFNLWSRCHMTSHESRYVHFHKAYVHQTLEDGSLGCDLFIHQAKWLPINQITWAVHHGNIMSPLHLQKAYGLDNYFRCEKNSWFQKYFLWCKLIAAAKGLSYMFLKGFSSNST